MSNSSKPEPPDQWLFLLPTTSQFNEVVTTSKSVVTVHLDGFRTADVYGLMQEIAKEMHFPAYFGFNWSALEDMLCDLEWLEVKDCCFVWNEGSRMLLNAPADFFTFLDVFSIAAKWWHERGVDFQMWLQDDYVLKVAQYWKSAVIRI